jgi:hypothetical protein
MDMKGKLSSKWNEAVASLVLDLVHQRKREHGAWDALPERSDKYFLELVTEQLERGRRVWREAQPKVKEDGNVEGLAEVEERMNEDKVEKGKVACANTRRRAVSPII